MGQRDEGFTLLELLVALLVFAFLAVMAYGGLQVVLEAQKRTTEQAMRLGELQVFFTILGRDVEQIIDRDIRDSYGNKAAAGGPQRVGPSYWMAQPGRVYPQQHAACCLCPR